MAENDNGAKVSRGTRERLLTWGISAILGAGGGVATRLSTDPFFGSEGRALERRVSILEARTEAQILPVAQVLITELEGDVANINQRIDAYIQDHNANYPPRWLVEKVDDHEFRLRMAGL